MEVIRDINPHLGHKNDVIPKNINIVHSVCQRFKKRAAKIRIEYDDMFGNGCIGLMKAFHKFDPTTERACKFSTFAFSYVEGYIQNFLRDHSGLIHVPRRVMEVAANIQDGGLLDAESRIAAKALGCSIEYVENAKDFLTRKIVSLDELLPIQRNDKIRVIDSIPVQEDFTSVEMIDFISTLSGYEIEIVGHLLMGKSQRDICSDMGKSPMTIRKTTRAIGEKLLVYIG